jgi:DNA-binding NtrC family response regulator
MQEELLVVDDEPQMLIAINETLQRSGYSITTAGSGLEALRRLKERHYKLVITDMRMPEVSGLDLLRKVKNLSPQTSVILLTAYGTIQNAVDAMRDGAYDYLLKPFSSESLQSVVRRALNTFPGKNGKTSHAIITQDPYFARTLEQASQAACTPATILIEAESGTGKELLARMIHQKSPRSSAAFVAVNCAALPENLLESELFGFEKGAFTGASVSKAGKFELAPILQAKLLRVLQEKEVDRIGGKDPVEIDVRVLATTNRDLQALVRNGDFREDLYYRLNVVRLTIPPLRNRREDIPLLVDFFCKRYGMNGHEAVRVSPDAIKKLKNHDWPGNVRELENAIQRAVALSSGSEIKPENLLLSEPQVVSSSQLQAPKPAEVGVSAGVTMREMERQLISRTLEGTGGNRTRAAKSLGISLRTLRNKLNEFGLQDRQAKSAHSPMQF